MFQNNPLLSQLKQQIRESKPRVEGIVKATDKSYGFLECDKKSYFIPPQAMKKLMHGDKISAVIETVAEDKEQAEPETLIEPMLTRFIARVCFNRDNKLQLAVDHPNITQLISATQHKDVTENLQAGDWVVANLLKHPLRDDRFFSAQITQFICRAEDDFAPWWVTLARHQQPREAVAGLAHYSLDENITRQDLTDIHFVTIDSASTQDMDDALYAEPIYQNGEITAWRLVVAIADPTAYIPIDSQIEQDAKQRCFTNYLPGFNIPMLPRELSDELCSLVPQQKRPALVCYIEIDMAGNLTTEPHFVAAWIESKAKLVYDEVSDFIEQGTTASWQPETAEIQQQIGYLHQVALARITWRKNNALTFNDRADYRFILAENGKVEEIKAEYRRIANRIVEECMILANVAAAQYLDKYAKCGIFNTHSGFDKKFLGNAQQFLLATLANDENLAELTERYSEQQLSTLHGYCQMQRDVEQFAQPFLELRLRRYLAFAEFKTESAPHFGLGLPAYATWTSPIRKYSDMVNHRLIKAILMQQPCIAPNEEVILRLQEARKQNRLVERDIADWLYALYLAPLVAESPLFTGEILDASRAGLRILLIENGASVFVPSATLHPNREEISFNNEELALYINGEKRYQIGEQHKVKLTEVRVETRSIIANIVAD